jgi:hypothetical protein
VHPDSHAVLLPARGDRVVEVLRGLGVDREREQLAQVDPALERRLRRLVGLERLPQPALGEQPLQYRLDVVGAPEDALELRAAAAGADDREVALRCLSEPLPVKQERLVRLEVRLADDELAAASEFDDGQRLVTTSSAASRASSTGVEGLSYARTSGRRPTPAMSRPPGVR